MFAVLTGCKEGKRPNSFETGNEQADSATPPTYSGIPKDEAKK
jgi:hypothetical protein